MQTDNVKIWDEHEDLFPLMDLLENVMIAKTKQYGFSYCRRGMVRGCAANLDRKADRFEEQYRQFKEAYGDFDKRLHDFMAAEQGAKEKLAYGILQSMGDFTNYGILTIMFIKYVFPEAYLRWAHEEDEFCLSVIPKEEREAIVTEAERRGIEGVGSQIDATNLPQPEGPRHDPEALKLSQMRAGDMVEYLVDVDKDDWERGELLSNTVDDDTSKKLVQKDNGYVLRLPWNHVRKLRG